MARAKLNIDNPLISASEPTAKPKGRPRNPELLRNETGGNAAQAGLPVEYKRFTAIYKVELIELLKDYAYTKRLPIRDVVTDILEDFFRRYQSDPNNEPILHRRKV